MKRAVPYVIAASLVAAVYVIRSNYDVWFVFPKFRALISNNLKDPPSTQFRNERLIGEGWVCGELNSKNSNGGYVGFKKYIVSTVGEAYLEDHGYVGAPDPNGETKRVIDRMDIEIQLLQERNALIKATGADVNLSDYEKRDEVTRRYFNKKWAGICGA